MNATDKDRPSWRIRRRVVLTVLTFCAGITVYLTGWGKDDELRATIASGVLFLAGSVVMAYVFGVVWNDTSAMRHHPRQADPYAGAFAGAGAPPAPPAPLPPALAGDRPPGMPQGE